MSWAEAVEPTLAQVAAQFPAWQCWEGPNRLCYARHPATGTKARGEDPLDLRDQLSAAERLRACEREAAQGDPEAQR